MLYNPFKKDFFFCPFAFVLRANPTLPFPTWSAFPSFVNFLVSTTLLSIAYKFSKIKKY